MNGPLSGELNACPSHHRGGPLNRRATAGSDDGALRIGSLILGSPLLLAPIARYCDLAFRQTIRPLGGLGLASTALIHPRGLLRRTPKSMELVETEPGDHPLCAQLYGSEPGELAEAAAWCAAHGAAVIDLNMGCPVEKVTRHAGGAALLRDPAAAVRLAARVVRAVPVPVTVKMRLGWDEAHIVAPHLAAALEDVGVAAVTVHARTAVQGFRGQARREAIAEVVRAVRSLPVIGNGDIRRPQDAVDLMVLSGCRGVMIGRAALRHPWLFRETQALLTTGRVPAPPSFEERLAFMVAHFRHLLRLRGERRACLAFRQRASWYLPAMGDFPEFRQHIRRLCTADQFDRWVRRWLRPAANPAMPREDLCSSII